MIDNSFLNDSVNMTLKFAFINAMTFSKLNRSWIKLNKLNIQQNLVSYLYLAYYLIGIHLTDGIFQLVPSLELKNEIRSFQIEKRIILSIHGFFDTRIFFVLFFNFLSHIFNFVVKYYYIFYSKKAEAKQ